MSTMPVALSTLMTNGSTVFSGASAATAPTEATAKAQAPGATTHAIRRER